MFQFELKYSGTKYSYMYLYNQTRLQIHAGVIRMEYKNFMHCYSFYNMVDLSSSQSVVVL